MIIGREAHIYWPEDKAWYKAYIDTFHVESHGHRVLYYEDCNWEFVDFTKTKKGLIIDIYFFVIKNGKVKWQKIYSTTLSSFNNPSKTIFTIGLLPLGGYVKMKGILDESMDSEFKGEEDELESKNSLQKIWVMSAGVIMNLILTFFVFTHSI